MYAAFLMAMLYLLFFHLSSDAPLRSGGHRPVGLDSGENIQNAIVEEMKRAARGKNLQVRFKLPEEIRSRAFFFATLYYRASYEFLPRRVFVGNDDHVINFPGELMAADQPETADWLRQRDVPAVFWLMSGDERGPALWVDRVP
jgi:hypothetical protein